MTWYDDSVAMIACHKIRTPQSTVALFDRVERILDSREQSRQGGRKQIISREAILNKLKREKSMISDWHIMLNLDFPETTLVWKREMIGIT